MDLLDSGSTDVVLVTPDWQSVRTQLLGTPETLGSHQQMLVLTATSAEPADLTLLKGDGWLAQVETSDWSALRNRLRFAGEKPLAAVWPSSAFVRLLGNVAQVRLHGLGEWPDVVFVDIPAGTFVMGSPDREVGRLDTAGPRPQVSVPALQMARTETTNAQFRVFALQHKGENDLPVVDVTGEQARAFCERYGWRLPTEAAWEYAARAGTQTRWSFDDDERLLGAYAWYANNARGQPHPVGRKQPNSWGLFDMHGNVWEWVQDCWHDSYTQAPTDGRAWETDKCTRRVVRGGSFDITPAFSRFTAYLPEKT